MTGPTPAARVDARHPLLLCVLSALLFGAATPISKVLLDGLSPFALAGLLYVGAALAVAPLALLRSHAGAPRPFHRAGVLRLGGAIVLGGVAGPLLLLFGLRMSTAGSVSLLLNLETAATAALGAWIFHEPLARSGWLGALGVALAGAMLCSGGGWPGLAAGLLVAAAAVCWAMDNHLTALVDGMTPARATLWKGAVAGVVNLALATAFGGFAAAPVTIAVALLAGALCYGASIALYIAAAQQLGATRAQAVFTSAPFLGAALSFALLGEPLATIHVLAAVLLVASLTAMLRHAHGHPHAHAATEHVHSHRHDDGHHAHDHVAADAAGGIVSATRHTHWHRHDPVEHVHPHWPDLHHRHEH